jgi:NAD-dependent DNA ligase
MAKLSKKLKALEDSVMAHRYLYYVEATPVITDAEYDVLERKARAGLPEDSSVQKVGSSLEDDYSPEQVAIAKGLAEKAGF